MAKYLFQVHPQVAAQDLPNLPVELRELFLGSIRQQLVTNPAVSSKFQTHTLSGKLASYRAVEIEWQGNPNAYRLVYRVYDKPAPRRVLVLSFDEHDAAYDKAKERAGRNL